MAGGIAVREFRETDAPELHRLSIQSLEGTVGHATWDLRTWQWGLLENPDIGGHRILVADDASGMAGFCAMDRRGTVRALVGRRGPDRAAILEALLAAAEGACREEGAALIQVSGWGGDHGFGAVAARRGFREVNLAHTVFHVPRLRPLIEAILARRPSAARSLGGRGLRFEIAPGWAGGEVETFTVGAGRAGAGNGRVPTVRASNQALVDVLLAGASPLGSLLRGRVHVTPAWCLLRAWRVLVAVRRRQPWFTPRWQMR